MKTTNVWSWSFFVIIVAFHNSFYSRLAYGLSISPPSEEIFSNQLCPDPTTKVQSSTPESPQGTSWSSWWPSTKIATPQNSRMPSKLLVVNLDKPKESTHFYESCSFKEQWEQGAVFTGKLPRIRHSVRVRSINLNVNPWNFTSAQKCNTFIKFNNWDVQDNGLVVGGRYPVLCGRENFDQYLGPYGYPMVLYYQWKKGGVLSFPLFHSSYGEHHKDRKEAMDLQYMQIYFIVSGSKDLPKKCRVQQYRLDWLRTGCSMILDDEDVCGEYHCPDLEALYQSKMTIFKEGDGDNDTMLVWKTKTDKYKMRSFLRQKFVPVVFLIVLICAYRSYMKAGLRYQNSIHDDVSEFRVRSIRRRVPTARPYPAPPGPGPYITTADAYWDFPHDDDPPPQYVASRSNADRPLEGVISNDPSNMATTSPLSTEEDVQNLQCQQPPKQHNDEPPPPYDSVYPPTYGEATIK